MRSKPGGQADKNLRHHCNLKEYFSDKAPFGLLVSATDKSCPIISAEDRISVLQAFTKKILANAGSPGSKPTDYRYSLCMNYVFSWKNLFYTISG